MTRLALSNHGLRNSGGIERYALTVVRGLHARGVRPVFIAKRFDPALDEYAWVEPVRVRMMLLPGKVHDLFFDWRIQAIKRHRALFPLIACNQTGAADIAILGSTHPGFLEAMGASARLSDRWKFTLERAHLTRSRLIVAHSRRMADEAVRFYGVAADKIRLLYPPVDGARFCTVGDAQRSALREALQLPADRTVFLLASTGHSRKGLALLLDYFARTELPVSLVVAGRPIDTQLANVRYLGYRTDIENVFRAVDFTIVASAYEPFGLVGVESVLCGTPVLIADGVGCGEVITGAAHIAFDRARAGSLGAAIEAAAARRAAGTHRLADPAQSLAYDASVDTHVDALLAMVREIGG